MLCFFTSPNKNTAFTGSTGGKRGDLENGVGHNRPLKKRPFKFRFVWHVHIFFFKKLLSLALNQRIYGWTSHKLAFFRWHNLGGLHAFMCLIIWTYWDLHFNQNTHFCFVKLFSILSTTFLKMTKNHFRQLSFRYHIHVCSLIVIRINFLSIC